MLAVHASLAPQLKSVTQSVLDAAREDADVRRLMTVPGIGSIIALAFKAALDDPKTLLVIVQGRSQPRTDATIYQSDNNEWFGSIGQTHDPLLGWQSIRLIGVFAKTGGYAQPLPSEETYQ